MATLRFTRDQLIEALEARRPWAEHLDAKNLAEHQKAEKAYLAKFRAACREAVKWDYQTAKKNSFLVIESASRYHGGGPDCPTSWVTKLNHSLNVVRASRQKTYTVAEIGGWASLYHLLTYDETLVSKMC